MDGSVLWENTTDRRDYKCPALISLQDIWLEHVGCIRLPFFPGKKSWYKKWAVELDAPTSTRAL